MILVHNYQRPEIARSDYIGDSLGLCIKAQEMKAKIIVFWGVHFMAESAAVMNPDKSTVTGFGCRVCVGWDMITAEAFCAKSRKVSRSCYCLHVN